MMAVPQRSRVGEANPPSRQTSVMRSSWPRPGWLDWRSRRGEDPDRRTARGLGTVRDFVCAITMIKGDIAWHAANNRAFRITGSISCWRALTPNRPL